MRSLLVIAFVISSFINALSWGNEPTIDAQLMSPLGQGFSYVPSPGPVDLVTVGPVGSRMAVYRNGEPGPRFDEIVTTEPMPEGGGGIAVVFSADGWRFAYVGRKRDEFTLIVDGEEVLSGKYDGGGNTIAGVGFNADNHLHYRIRQDAGPWHFVMDGESSPALATNQMQVMLSPVGKGYVLIGTLMEPREQVVIRDGEVVELQAMNFIYRNDGKLFTIERDADTSETVIKLEGEEKLRGDYVVQHLVPAPVGENWLLIATSRSRGLESRIFVNGEELEGHVSKSINSDSIWFSDDGAHWAVIVEPQTARQYMLIDGEDYDEYEGISEFSFSPDGTRHAYWGRSPSGFYLVIDGEEQEGVSLAASPVVWGGRGANVGWKEQANNPTRYSVLFNGTRYVGGQHLPYGNIGLSPDGKRMAVLDAQTLVEFTEAGVKKHEGMQVMARTRGSRAHGGYLPMPTGFIFSPDSRHLVTWGTDLQTGKKNVFFNGNPVFEAAGNAVLRIGFSPDSKHLFLMNADTGSERTLYVDGQPVMRLGTQPLEQEESMWTIDDDGLLHFMIVDNEGIKRVTVTPSPDRTIDDLAGG